MNGRPLRHRLLLSSLPLAVAVVIAALFGIGAAPNLVLAVRADLVVLALLAGGVGTILVAAVLALRRWADRIRRESAACTQARADDDRRRFLRRLDHELKNPLTAIRAGVANLAASQPVAGGDDTLARTLHSIGAQTMRLSRLATDLRKLAELETWPLERAPTDLDDLMREVVAVGKEHPDAAERSVTLTLPQAPWPLPTVVGDRDLLFLVLYNLLDNALKFTHPGDTIEVRAFEDGATVVIEVADTGPGLPEAEAAHVWEELYRGEAARSLPGSGLGLALVRAVVAQHGGQASLRSRPGRGTVVSVRLPSGG